MSERWTPIEMGLPTEGAPVLVRWADGTTHRATLRDAGPYIAWEVDADTPPETPPVAWKTAERTGRRVLAGMGQSWMLAIFGLAAAALIALAMPIMGLAVGVFALLWWAWGALANALAEKAAEGRGRAGALLGALIILAMLGLPVLAWLVIVMQLWRAYA